MEKPGEERLPEIPLQTGPLLLLPGPGPLLLLLLLLSEPGPLLLLLLLLPSLLGNVELVVRRGK